MLSFFFYGTLMDPDLQAAVLGGRLPAGMPAVLAGYRRRLVAGRDYPAIAPAEGASVSGLLLDGVSPAMAARASLYEGPQYTSASLPVTTEDGTSRNAWTFLPVPGVRLGAGDWCLEAWRRRRKALTLKHARAFMAALPAGGPPAQPGPWRARARQFGPRLVSDAGER